MRRYNIEVVVIIIIIPFGIWGGLVRGAKILVNGFGIPLTDSLACEIVL